LYFRYLKYNYKKGVRHEKAKTSFIIKNGFVKITS